MAVKIKLKRLGKIHAPQYRIVVADSRTARNGRAIEEIGVYQPMSNPSLITVDSDRVQYWLGVGAQPTDAVAAILRVTGDWQKFKGLPGAEGTLEVPAAKPSKTLAYEAAVQEAATETKTTTRKPKLEPEAAGAAAAAEVVEADKPAETVVEKVTEAVEGAAHAVAEVVEKAVDAVETVVGDAITAIKGEDGDAEAAADEKPAAKTDDEASA